MKKRFIFIPLAIVILLVVVWFFFFRIPVHVAEMSETVIPHQFGLQVGSSVLGWSSHANNSTQRNGYIYMRDERPDGGNKPLWEFAMTTKRRLSDVTQDDLRCPFYGMDDPRGPNVFGDAWEDGTTILVPEGQVFFARLVADRSVIYVIRLTKQGGSGSSRGTMRIEYRAFTGQPSNKSPEPTAIGAFSSAIAVRSLDAAWLSFIR
jgi:hypothetical protein